LSYAGLLLRRDSNPQPPD